ncbi:MAG: polysaccharide biosynthesis protein, partial [Shewanella sp.]
MVGIDLVLLGLAYWSAFWVRLDDQAPFADLQYWQLFAFISMLTVLVFIRIGLYRAVLRYVSAKVIGTVAWGVIFSTLLLVISAYFSNVFLPRTVSVIYFIFSLVFICGSRLAFRMMLNYGVRGQLPVIIYGAG